MLGAVLLLERRLLDPRRIREVEAIAAGERVPAALRDGVDDAAREPPVLGGQPRRQYLRVLDRVLDEEALRIAEQVVRDVDAVDHEVVVVGERTVDRQLRGIRRRLVDGRRQRRDAEQRARRGQSFDLRMSDVEADAGLRELRGHLADDADFLDHRRNRERQVLLDSASDRNARPPLHGGKRRH